jgi:hypothetical protein
MFVFLQCLKIDLVCIGSSLYLKCLLLKTLNGSSSQCVPFLIYLRIFFFYLSVAHIGYRPPIFINIGIGIGPEKTISVGPYLNVLIPAGTAVLSFDSRPM